MTKRIRLTNRLIWKHLRERSTREPRVGTPAVMADAAVGTVAPAPKRTFLWDSSQPGLAAMVTERGHLSFIYQYRHNGTAYRLTFKRYRTLEDARKLATEAASARRPLRGPRCRRH
jgi:hypothetical protein